MGWNKKPPIPCSCCGRCGRRNRLKPVEPGPLARQRVVRVEKVNIVRCWCGQLVCSECFKVARRHRNCHDTEVCGCNGCVVRQGRLLEVG